MLPKNSAESRNKRQTLQPETSPLATEHCQPVITIQTLGIPPASISILPSPNLVYAGCEESNVFISPNPRRGIGHPRTPHERDKSFPALSLSFENTLAPGEVMRPTLKVIAKLTFESRTGATRRVMDHGVWLNSSSQSVDIEAGGTQKLLVMRLEENRFVTFEDQRASGHSLIKQGPRRATESRPYLEPRLVDGLEFLNVTLLEIHTQTSMVYSFRAWWDEGTFCVSQTSS